MKNFRLFETEAERIEAVIEECSVSYVIESNKVYTTPENGGGQSGDTVKNYMKLTALNGGTVSATFLTGEDIDRTSPNISYSYDGIVWESWDFNELILNTGQSLYLKGYNENGFPHPLKFYLNDIVDKEWGDTISEGEFSVSGNIMSLLYGDDFENKTTLPIDYCFYGMFGENDKLIDVSNLILPATTLTESCYASMFQYCSNLKTAPELPATKLASSCYSSMFYNCDSLTTAPKLPATTLTYGCYQMMFYSCTNLNHIAMLATDMSASNSLYNWVYRVSSTGTFVKHPDMTSLRTGQNGIPNGWTVEDAVI